MQIPLKVAMWVFIIFVIIALVYFITPKTACTKKITHISLIIIYAFLIIFLSTTLINLYY